MRKDRILKSLLAASLLGALAAASPAPAGVTPAAAAGQGGKPAQGQTKFRRVRVNAADIDRLPRRENYVVYVGDTPRKKAGGYDGHLPVPGDYDSDGDGATKPRKGAAPTVYEFRSDRPIDFTRVVVRAGPDAAPVPLEAWLRKHRPAAGMRGWPFKRLLIGPPEGIAQVEGWKIKEAKPDAEYKCEYSNDVGSYCGCSGLLDCTLLLVSANCSSDMSCGDGECFCDTE